MANETADFLDNLVVAVAALLVEITTYIQVHTEEPDSIGSGPEVAVLADRGVAGQEGVQMHGETHFLLLRTYIPLGAAASGPEQTIRKLWNLQTDKFNAHDTLNGTCSTSYLIEYNCGWGTLGHVPCRIMDSRLKCFLLAGVPYA